VHRAVKNVGSSVPDSRVVVCDGARADRRVRIERAMLVAVVLPLERLDARVVAHHYLQQVVAHTRHSVGRVRRRVIAVVADYFVVCLRKDTGVVTAEIGHSAK